MSEMASEAELVNESDVYDHSHCVCDDKDVPDE